MLIQETRGIFTRRPRAGADDRQPPVHRAAAAAAFSGPGTERDFRDVIASEDRPIIGHEIGQWTFYPNFDEIKKYTGVLAAKNFELVRDDLKAKHMLDLAPRFVAGHRQARRAALQGGNRSAAAHAGLRRVFAAGPARLSRRRARR